MDLKDLKQLISLMNENELVEVELEEEGRKVRLKKGGAEWRAVPMPAVAPPAGPDAGNSHAQAQEKGQTQITRKIANLKEITSPMVGTFYRTPSPDSDPFVEIGDKVGDESVICIIEAMKVMNEIKAEMTGEIVDILVENGEAVEYGQTLFVVKPD